jgi:hypothetical protein
LVAGDSENRETAWRGHLVALVLSGLVLGSFWAWAVSSDPAPGDYVAYPAHEYFPLMVEGWLQGRLDLPLPVAEGLLRLPDPYDPEANEAYRYAGNLGVHDLSLYGHRLYMYWGPAPALVAFLPWRVLTGSGLSTAWAVWGFVLAGWLFTAMLLLHLIGRYYPQTRWAVALAVLLVVGFGNFAAVVLTRASVYEVSIAAAYAFTSLAWWQLAVALWRPPLQRAMPLAAASLAFGLAIASRPSWIVVTPVLLAALWDVRDQWRLSLFRVLSTHAILPVLTCLIALLLLNTLRFDNPLEFGTRYQLMAQRPPSGLFAVEHIPLSVCMYLLTPPGITDYFPFLLPLPAQDVWGGTRHAEITFGLLPLLPVLWLALLSPSALWKTGMRNLVLVLGAAFLAVVTVLSAFHFGVALRYALDLAPLLALLAAIGLLQGETSARRAVLSRWAFRILWMALLIASLCMTLCAVSSREPAPRSINSSPIALWANAAAVLLGWAPDSFVRRLELDIMLPEDIPPLREEVIVATGRSPYHNVLYLRRPDPHHVVVGFHRGDGQRDESAPVPIDASVPHNLLVEFGSLYPPQAHPYWLDIDETEKQALRSQVLVSLDSTVLLKGDRFQWPSANARPVYGDLPGGSTGVSNFTGRILAGREHRQLFDP